MASFVASGCRRTLVEDIREQFARSHAMPRGDKSSYSDKQKRQAQHIEESEKKGGRSSKAAERIAWATVNKQDGGAKKKSSSH